VLVLLLAVSFSVAAGSVPAPAPAQDNAAVAVNTQDDSFVHDFSLDIQRATGKVVDNSNTALAYQSCEECQALAVALQVVLVLSDPNVIVPENLAVAVNEECVSCATAALAYQYVLLGDGLAVHFTGEGSQGIAEIQREFRELERSGLSFDEMVDRANELIAELDAIIAREVVAAGSAQAISSTSSSGTEAVPAETSEAVTDAVATSDPTAWDTSATTTDEATAPATMDEPSAADEYIDSTTEGEVSPEESTSTAIEPEPEAAPTTEGEVSTEESPSTAIEPE
jgi:putative peptide zinc metalloprotease protein